MDNARLSARLGEKPGFQTRKRARVYIGCLRKTKRTRTTFDASKRASKRAHGSYFWFPGLGMPSWHQATLHG